MKLKLCPSCKTPQTTRNAIFKGRVGGLLWFNCKSCLTTFILKPKLLKSLLLLALINVGCASHEAKTTRGFYKFLVAGQSNSVSPAQGDFKSIYSSTGLVEVNDYYGENANGDNLTESNFIVPTQEHPVMGGVAWVMLGDKLDRPSRFNIIGQGNTSTRVWRNSLYIRLIRALQRDEYDAILWVQGESDSGEQISSEETYQNMRFLIEVSQSIRPNVPWVIALNGMSRDQTKLYNGDPRKAQLRLIQEGFAIRGPDIDSLRANEKFFESSKAEFSNVEGLQAHANAWFEVISSLFGGK